MNHDLLKSHHFLKFGEKRYEKNTLENKIC